MAHIAVVPSGTTLVPVRLPLRRVLVLLCREMAIASVVATAVGAVVTALVGWGTPFANDPSPHALHRLVLSCVTCLTALGGLVACPLILMMVTARRSAKPSTVWQKTYESVAQVWQALVVGTLLAVAATGVLITAGVPVIQYNLHSLVCCVAVQCLTAHFTATFVHRQRASLKTATPPSGVVPIGPPRRKRKRFGRILRQAFRVNIPPTIAAVVTVNFITVARHVPLDSLAALVRFSIACACLKMAMPVLTKLFMAKQTLPSLRVAFFMIMSPALHVEIQQRMALFRAQQTTPVYAASALLGLLEVAIRIATVGVELVLVRRRRQRVDIQIEAVRSQQTPQRSVETTIAQLNTEFKQWKAAHLKMCAAEILAEMAAEYCGMAVVSVCVIVLHRNASFDLAGAASPHGLSSDAVVVAQLQSWGTQALLEVAADVVAVAIEARLGIPFGEVLVINQVTFLRWIVVVIAMHASGLCVSSLVVEPHTVANTGG